MKKSIFCFIIGVLMTSCFKKESVDIPSENKDLTKMDSAAIVVDVDRQENSKQNQKIGIDSTQQNIPQPISKISYSEAEKMNTAEGWRTFLKDHPEYENKEEISEKIIRAEVKEIMKDEETGQMPSSEKIRGGNQALSVVSVDNNTSCDLVLRYSGTDAKKIAIPPNSKQKISLRSGAYQVTATACGYNYAGSETLSGEYDVVYYISTVRY